MHLTSGIGGMPSTKDADFAEIRAAAGKAFGKYAETGTPTGTIVCEGAPGEYVTTGYGHQYDAFYVVLVDKEGKLTLRAAAIVSSMTMDYDVYDMLQ